VRLRVLIADDRPLLTEGIFGRIGGNTPDALTDREHTKIKSIYKKLGVRYWTEVNPKSILKEFWHRIRKDK
jgi:hypothetical protein